MPGGVEQTNSGEMLDLAESQLLHEKGSPDRTLIPFGLLLVAFQGKTKLLKVQELVLWQAQLESGSVNDNTQNVTEEDGPYVLWVAIGTPRL